jgi:hypothetical protein
MKAQETIYDEIPTTRKGLVEYIELMEKYLKDLYKPVNRAEKIIEEAKRRLKNEPK